MSKDGLIQVDSCFSTTNFRNGRFGLEKMDKTKKRQNLLGLNPTTATGIESFHSISFSCKPAELDLKNNYKTSRSQKNK